MPTKRYTEKRLKEDVARYNDYIAQDNLSPGRFFVNPRNSYCAVDFKGANPAKPTTVDNVCCGTPRECLSAVSAWYADLYNKHNRK